MKRFLPMYRGEHPMTAFSNSFDQLRNEIDQWFDEVTHGFPGAELVEKIRFGGPSVEVSQTEKEVVVSAELPGVENKDLDVRVYDREVVIKAEKKRSEEFKSENVFRSERYYGQVQRSVPLPADVDPDQAKASFKDGILTITIQKAAPSEPGRKLEIE
ncbi:MAG: Hsp20/alpha crystallin family protein [Solirubrobacterales bacterium]